MSYIGNLNRITIEGNVGGDVDVKELENDALGVNFTVAQFVGAKDKNTEKFVPQWWGVRIYSKIDADGNSLGQWVVDNIKKGMAVVIDGRVSGFIPNSEYELAEKNPEHKVRPLLYIDASQVKILHREEREATGSKRESVPAFK